MADYDPQPYYPSEWERRFKQGYLPIDSGLEYMLKGPSDPMYPPNSSTEQPKFTLRYDTPFDPQANQHGNYPRYDPGPFSAGQTPQPPKPGETPPLYDPGYPGKETLGRAYENLTSRPTYPSGAPPAPGVPQGGPAQQFMGVQPPKTQMDRMPGMEPSMPAGVKGNPWGDPYGRPQNLPPQGAPPQGAPQGAGAPSGGGAPSQPQGPITLQGVMQSLAQANPEMMKTKEGRITLGMAAVKFAPLMRKDDQQELQHMKLEMNNQIQMLKLAQREQEIGIKQQRADDYATKGGSREDKTQKEYDTVSKQANDLANHMAVNPNSKDLRARYDATMLRLKTLDEQINPPEKSKVYSDWIKSNPSRIEESIPDDVKRILSPEEFKQILERQRTDPENAYARIKWLQQKVGSRESTMEKSYGNY